MAGIKEQLEKIDNLSLRERIILLVGGFILILILWFNFFYEPLNAEKEALRTRIDQKRSETETLTLQLQVLQERKQPDPNEKNRQQREQLLADIGQSRNEIISATTNLVAPDRMPELLKTVLTKIKGLQLVKLNGLGKTPLLETAENKEDGEKADAAADTDYEFDTAYKHGMKIVFEGDFFSTLEYIKKLESLEWRFFWDSVEFKVEDYPRTLSSVTLYTLSLDQNWIGI